MLNCCFTKISQWKNLWKGHCSKASDCKYAFSLGCKLALHPANPRVRRSSRPPLNSVSPMLRLCVRQSFSRSNLNPFWPWCQFHLHRSGGFTVCQSPKVHSIISTGEKCIIIRNTQCCSQRLAFRKCKKLEGQTKREERCEKTEMGTFSLFPTLKQSSRTSGEELLLTNGLQEHPLTPDPELLLSFAIQHSLTSSTQLVRQTWIFHPSFSTFNYSLHLLLYTPTS